MNRNFLVVRLSSLGDVLLTTGVLRYWHLKSNHRFVVVTRKPFTDIFKNHPAVVRVVPLSDETSSLIAWWTFCHQLKNEFAPMDLIDLHGTPRTAFLKHIWPGKTFSYPKMTLSRRMFAWTGHDFFRRKLLSQNIPQRYSCALPGKIPPKDRLAPVIYLEKNEILQARQTLMNRNLKDFFVCLHPYATHKAKAWPEENWKKLVSLLEKNNISWLITGRNSQPLFPGDPRDLTNETSIRQTAALIKISQAMITGDSGPMHLASAAGTRTIALFGPTTKEWGFYPESPGAVILEKELSCRPCSLHGQATSTCLTRCMKMIEPEKVLKALLTTLDKNGLIQ